MDMKNWQVPYHTSHINPQELQEENTQLQRACGISFSILVPGQRPLAVPQEQVIRQGKRIVVVDDSATVRTLLQMCFTQNGFETHVFEHGIALFHWLLTSEGSIPDLLFLDLQLPKIDGYHIVRHLKAQDAFQKTVLWLMSGKDGSLERHKARAVGADGYLTKPFQPKEALAIARSVLHPVLEY
jgi:twitching motility two-component system response regulator PilG